MAGKRSSEAEFERRVFIAERLLSEGMTRHDIWRYMTTEEGIEVSQSQVDRYIFQAKGNLVDEFSEMRREHYALMLARLDDLYSKAMQEGDSKLALKIIETQVRLQRLDEVPLQETSPMQQMLIRALQDQMVASMGQPTNKKKEVLKASRTGSQGRVGSREHKKPPICS